MRNRKERLPYKDKERKKAYDAAWRKANPEKVRASKAAWRKANPEKVWAYQYAWRKANPDKVKAIDARKRITRKQREIAAMFPGLFFGAGKVGL
jgi:hypothetical protein